MALAAPPIPPAGIWIPSDSRCVFFVGGFMQYRHIALALCGCALPLLACDRSTPTDLQSPASIAANQNAQGGAPRGFTDGWQNGKTVLFFYNKGFFCAQPP